jgi:hypothetical protein
MNVRWLLFVAVLMLLLSVAGLMWQQFGTRTPRRLVLGSFALLLVGGLVSGATVAFGQL